MDPETHRQHLQKQHLQQQAKENTKQLDAALNKARAAIDAALKISSRQKDDNATRFLVRSGASLHDLATLRPTGYYKDPDQRKQQTRQQPAANQKKPYSALHDPELKQLRQKLSDSSHTLHTHELHIDKLANQKLKPNLKTEQPDRKRQSDNLRQDEQFRPTRQHPEKRKFTAFTDTKKDRERAKGRATDQRPER